MAWLESHQDLGRHPKTKRLARSLAVSVPTAIGHLHLLWWWALDFADNGILTAYSAGEIAEAALWEGDPESFVVALTQAGFIDQTENALSIHDWDEYAGKLVDARRNNAEKQKRWRESHRHVTNTKEEQQAVRNDDVTVTYPLRNPATVPNTTGPNMTGPEIVSSAEETAPSGAASFRSALDQAKHDLEQPKANKAGVVGRVFENVYGRRPAFGFLAALIRDYDAPYELCCLMVEMLPDWNGCDDPQKFLAGVISTRKDKRRANGRSPPSNPYLTAEQLAEKARLDQEQLAEFVAQDQAKWKH